MDLGDEKDADIFIFVNIEYVDTFIVFQLFFNNKILVDK